MTREEFKLAFDEAMSLEYAYLDEMPKPQFSPKFEKRMHRMLKAAGKNNRFYFLSSIQKALAVAASILIIITCTMQVNAISEPIINLIKTVYEEYILISFDDTSIIDYIATEYHLTYMPEGFTCSKSIRIESVNSNEYKDDSGKYISLTQQVVKQDSQMNLDNENGTTRNISVSGMDVLLYTSDYSIMAFWVQDNYSMALCCVGGFDEATVIAMIESVKPIDDNSTTQN